MTIQEIQNKILTDDDFISQEIKKILTYYELKHTLRWSHDSSEIDEKESVAEHVYGMYVLCDYFLPLQKQVLNETIVKDLIQWHDMSETLVDDMTTLSKTDSHRNAEKEAESTLIKSAPSHLQVSIQELFTQYNSQETAEAQFVKAIDKLEPLFHIRFISEKLDFKKDVVKHNLTSEILDKYQQNRLKYIENFPDILAFSQVLSAEIKKTNYIHPEA